MVVTNILYKKSVYLKYGRISPTTYFKDQRKSVATGELTLQTNYNKPFLKWL